MPVNQTLIAAALSFLISAPTFADSYSHPAAGVGHNVAPNEYGSHTRGYLGTVADSAPTEWNAPKSENDAAILMLRELIAYANISAADLRKATTTSIAFFCEHAIEPPDSVRIITRHDPEDGRGYLRIEFPVSIGSSDELADLDFDLTMRVAGLLISGTENLVVSIIRA